MADGRQAKRVHCLHEAQSLSKQTKAGSQSEVFIEQSGTQHGGLTLPNA